MINVSIILLIADAVRFSMFSTALSELSYGTLNTYIYKGAWTIFDQRIHFIMIRSLVVNFKFIPMHLNKECLAAKKRGPQHCNSTNYLILFFFLELHF